MNQFNNTADAMRTEMSYLAQACGAVKSHPAFAQFQTAKQFSDARVDVLQQYAAQLERLMATINQHAAALRSIAKGDMEAAHLGIVAERIVKEVTSHVMPMIENLRHRSLMRAA